MRISIRVLTVNLFGMNDCVRLRVRSTMAHRGMPCMAMMDARAYCGIVHRLLVIMCLAQPTRWSGPDDE